MPGLKSIFLSRFLRHKKRVTTLVLAFLTISKVSFAQVVPEHQVKAVFLYNFAQFVQWPDSAFASPEAPLVIGILGEDPFGSYLDQAVRREQVKGRSLVVRRYKNIRDVQKCHILYVSYSDPEEVKKVLAHLRSSSVLTVGDAPGFAYHGGIIQFYKVENRMRIRINHKQARNSDLNISAKLLNLAEIVNY